jgi:hypothetical protein
LDGEVQFQQAVYGTNVDKVPIKEHVVRFVQSVGYDTVTCEMLFAALVMYSSNQLVLDVLLNAEKVWYRERLSIQAVFTGSNSLGENMQNVWPRRLYVAEA